MEFEDDMDPKETNGVEILGRVEALRGNLVASYDWMTSRATETRAVRRGAIAQQIYLGNVKALLSHIHEVNSSCDILWGLSQMLAEREVRGTAFNSMFTSYQDLMETGARSLLLLKSTAALVDDRELSKRFSMLHKSIVEHAEEEGKTKKLIPIKKEYFEKYEEEG